MDAEIEALTKLQFILQDAIEIAKGIDQPRLLFLLADAYLLGNARWKELREKKYLLRSN